MFPHLSILERDSDCGVQMLSKANLVSEQVQAFCTFLLQGNTPDLYELLCSKDAILVGKLCPTFQCLLFLLMSLSPAFVIERNFVSAARPNTPGPQIKQAVAAHQWLPAKYRVGYVWFRWLTVETFHVVSFGFRLPCACIHIADKVMPADEQAMFMQRTRAILVACDQTAMVLHLGSLFCSI